MKPAIYGKNSKKEGLYPAVALTNPKFERNVAGIVRACSCYGVRQLWWSGNRVQIDPSRKRLPREERLRGYKDVELRHYDNFFDQFDSDVVPVAVELMPNSESLVSFEHPKKALYVFGPEDGSISQMHLRHCHRFIAIPSRHCLNLSAAVYTVLYDRQMKLNPEATIYDTLSENRENFDLSDKELAEDMGLMR